MKSAVSLILGSLSWKVWRLFSLSIVSLLGIDFFYFFMLLAYAFGFLKQRQSFFHSGKALYLYPLLHSFSSPSAFPVRPMLELLMLSFTSLIFPVSHLFVYEMYYEWVPHLFSYQSILFFIKSSPLLNIFIEFLINLTAYLYISTFH